jgi:hypothetical protein
VADRYPEDGGSRFLRNAGTYLSNYTASPAWKAVALKFTALRISNLILDFI